MQPRTPLPPPTQPVSPGTPADVAQKQSKKHLKTAERLAKLERKQNLKLARKARRRRRRLRVVNFILSLIRGALAAMIAWFGGLIITAAALGERVADVGDAIDARPGTQFLLIGGTFLAFLWGLTYFPFPRSYET